MGLIRLSHRLEDSEKVLIHMKNMIEKVQPELSGCAA
jgi:hypothetical protein